MQDRFDDLLFMLTRKLGSRVIDRLCADLGITRNPFLSDFDTTAMSDDAACILMKVQAIEIRISFVCFSFLNLVSGSLSQRTPCRSAVI